MERNQETLSTRDLAADDRVGERTTASDPVPHDREPAGEAPSEYDRDRTDREPAADEPGGAESPAGSSSSTSTNEAPLLSEELSGTLRRRWEEVQTRFVDEPRGAVEDADSLVANLMQQLAQSFAQERERLESQWGRGEDISTEDLRVALQRYRSFFQRLLST
jgi:hypothetical protein